MSNLSAPSRPPPQGVVALGSRAAPPHAQARGSPARPALPRQPRRGFWDRSSKNQIRMKGQQRMADANRPPPIAHDASNPNTMMILTPDQRAVLTGLLVNAIMDTGSNRVAALYRGILTSLSQLSPCTIDITEEMALAGAKTLAAAIRMDWDGLHPGRSILSIRMEGWRSRQRPSGRLHRSQPRHHRRRPRGPPATVWSNIVTSPPSHPPGTRSNHRPTARHRRVDLLPIMTAVRDLRHRIPYIRQDTGPVSFRFDRPTIILLGDDLHEARSARLSRRNAARRPRQCNAGYHRRL